MLSVEKPMSPESKLKGRPPLEPRIAALEALTAELLHRLCSVELRDKGGRVDATERLAVLEKQIAAMNDAFSNGNLPRPQYQSQFKVWPSANPATNGS